MLRFEVKNDNGSYTGSILVTHPTSSNIRAAIAAMMGFTPRERACLERGRISPYNDGTFSLTPTRKDGVPCTRRAGAQQITYWARPVSDQGVDLSKASHPAELAAIAESK